MSWTALVPLKAKGERKTRLAARLSSHARHRLSHRLFAHVSFVLGRTARIEQIVVLSSERPAEWEGAWTADEGRGLNVELEAARACLGDTALLVIHADLPLLGQADVDAVLDAAETAGIALAPDRHGTGTNALALYGGRIIRFEFGADSFQRHQEQAPDAAVIRREGLALDLDTPDDLERALACGFRLD